MATEAPKILKVYRSTYTNAKGEKKPHGNYLCTIRGPTGRVQVQLTTKDPTEAQRQAEAWCERFKEPLSPTAAPAISVPPASVVQPPLVAAALPGASPPVISAVPPAPPPPQNRVAAAFAKYAPQAATPTPVTSLAAQAIVMSPQQGAVTMPVQSAPAAASLTAAGAPPLSPEQLEKRRRRIAKTFARGLQLIIVGATAWTCKQFGRIPDAPAEDEEEILEDSLDQIMENAIRNPNISPWWTLGIAVPIMGAGMWRDGKPMPKEEAKVLQLHQGGKAEPDERKGPEGEKPA